MCSVDPDTITLDTFVALITRVDLLRTSQSSDEKVRNGLGIYALQRELAVAKQAGVEGLFFTG